MHSYTLNFESTLRPHANPWDFNITDHLVYEKKILKTIKNSTLFSLIFSNYIPLEGG